MNYFPNVIIIGYIRKKTMKSIFLKSNDFNTNIWLFKDKAINCCIDWNSSPLVPLLLIYLQHQKYIKLIKSNSKDIEEISKDSLLLASKILEEPKHNRYKLNSEELEDLNNGIFMYAIVITIPQTDPLYTIISQARDLIKSQLRSKWEDSFFQEDNSSTYLLFDFYKYLCEETINESNIRDYAKIIFDVYSEDIDIRRGVFGEVPKWITELMLRLLDAENGCLVHPYASSTNIIPQLSPNIFYSASYKDLEDYIVSCIYAEICETTVRCVFDDIPLELSNNSADYVFYDNTEHRSTSYLYEMIIRTIESNAKGIFFTNTADLRKFKNKIANMCTPSTPSFIMSEKISLIIFLPRDYAIILVEKEKEEKDSVILINATKKSQLDFETLCDDIYNNKNCYELSIEEFNQQHFQFDIKRILQETAKGEISKCDNVVMLKHLLLQQEKICTDIYNIKKKNINNTFISNFSVFRPYYAIENNELINISEQEVTEYQNKLLLIGTSTRFQPKILVFNNLDNISFSQDIQAYRIDEEKVDFPYLVMEMNKNYVTKQIFPTDKRGPFLRYKDLLGCYIKIPNTGSQTPLKEQRIIYNDEKLVFLQRLLSDYSYNIDDFASTSKMSLEPGVVLNNKYKIIEVLGNGGFGKTYKATTKNSDNRETAVAIKEFFCENFQFRAKDGKTVLTPVIEKIAEITSSRIKFMNEANKIKAYDSENIVKVYDVFNENETCYYVMEYIKGINLAEYSAMKGVIEESEAVRIIKSVANALKILHNDNMLHLDVKPENIMIANNGRIILVDFGAAHKYYISNNDNSTLISYASPGFTAPGEVSQYLFKACRDIYSLGRTLYYMFIDSEERQKMIDFDKKKAMEYLNEASTINKVASEYKMVRPNNISDAIWNCIEQCTNKTFYVTIKSIDEFLAMLPCE